MKQGIGYQKNSRLPLLNQTELKIQLSSRVKEMVVPEINHSHFFPHRANNRVKKNNLIGFI